MAPQGEGWDETPSGIALPPGVTNGMSPDQLRQPGADSPDISAVDDGEIDHVSDGRLDAREEYLKSDVSFEDKVFPGIGDKESEAGKAYLEAISEDLTYIIDSRGAISNEALLEIVGNEVHAYSVDFAASKKTAEEAEKTIKDSGEKSEKKDKDRSRLSGNIVALGGAAATATVLHYTQEGILEPPMFIGGAIVSAGVGAKVSNRGKRKKAARNFGGSMGEKAERTMIKVDSAETLEELGLTQKADDKDDVARKVTRWLSKSKNNPGNFGKTKEAVTRITAKATKKEDERELNRTKHRVAAVNEIEDMLEDGDPELTVSQIRAKAVVAVYVAGLKAEYDGEIQRKGRENFTRKLGIAVAAGLITAGAWGLADNNANNTDTEPDQTGDNFSNIESPPKGVTEDEIFGDPDK